MAHVGCSIGLWWWDLIDEGGIAGVGCVVGDGDEGRLVLSTSAFAASTAGAVGSVSLATLPGCTGSPDP